MHCLRVYTRNTDGETLQDATSRGPGSVAGSHGPRRRRRRYLERLRALAGDRSIAQALGALVEREVERERARRVTAGELDDQQLVGALARAQELHADLAAIVARLERRLDDRPAPASGPGRQGLA